MTILIMGGLTALGIFIIMMRIGITKFTGYMAGTEMMLFALLAFLFIGTMSGMMIGMVAGIALSIGLWVSKKLFGAKKLKRRGRFVSWQEVRNSRTSR
jgi:hypothetical protein